jgi:hypothetical protein
MAGARRFGVEERHGFKADYTVYELRDLLAGRLIHVDQ